MIGSLLHKFEHNQVFTESEAWMLFRLTAIAEACGWTLLIAGMACGQLLMHGNRDAVLIAGQIHGTFFCMYALAATGLYPTLGWSRKLSFVALLASLPPYGSLVFEQWAQHKRRTAEFKSYSCCLILAGLK